jgi:diguanylate cyclase (GGDEF)-like protein/PAS domain S-box-containing protein
MTAPPRETGGERPPESAAPPPRDRATAGPIGTSPIPADPGALGPCARDPRPPWPSPAGPSGTGLGIAVLDAEGTLIDANRRLAEILGRDLAELIGTRFEDFATQAEPSRPVTGPAVPARPAVGREAAWRGEQRLWGGDGLPLWCRLSVTPVPGTSGGSTAATVVVVEDLTEARRLEARMRRLAASDPLTGLANRAALLERIEGALGRAPGNKAGSGSGAIALLVVDLDRFKVVNDSLGHEAGDELLLAVARRIVEETVGEDGEDHRLVARIGGDDFAVLLEDGADADHARRLAERLVRALSAPLALRAGEVVVTASVGVAVAWEAPPSPEAVLRDAEAALHRAKDSGGSRVECCDERLRRSVRRRFETESGLRRALAEGELRLLYQPIRAVADGRLAGVEALVRWQHPRAGLLRPERFIEVAEETGLVVPLGAFVLDQACRDAASWGPPPGFCVAVNLSARQLVRPGLAEHLAATLEATGLRAEAVSLEITESVLMDDAPSALALLRSLKALGVRLSVDDFGTGYSSLRYLRRLPVDCLKIDGSFVHGVDRDPEDAAIVAAVVRLAQSLGLDAIAEGVETVDQLAELDLLGCPFAQGYLLGRPAPAIAIAALLSAEQGASPEPALETRPVA